MRHFYRLPTQELHPADEENHVMVAAKVRPCWQPAAEASASTHLPLPHCAGDSATPHCAFGWQVPTRCCLIQRGAWKGCDASSSVSATRWAAAAVPLPQPRTDAPTRTACAVRPLDMQLTMHHYSMVRLDIRSKLRNVSNRANYDTSGSACPDLHGPNRPLCQRGNLTRRSAQTWTASRPPSRPGSQERRRSSRIQAPAPLPATRRLLPTGTV